MLRDSRAKFDHKVLEECMKRVIQDSPLRLEPNASLKSPFTCKTFVVSTMLRASGFAVRMHSYDTLTADAFLASIWQAARATLAALTLFLLICINGIIYGDGGVGWNNPSEEAIAEARSIWFDRPIGCFISLGTGLKDAVQLIDQSDPRSVARTLFRVIASCPSFKLDVAEYCMMALTSCERVHRKLDEHPEHFVQEGNSFRLNVPQSMSKIGLEEWKRLEDMVVLTQDYMENNEDARRKKYAIAWLLINDKFDG